MTVMGQPQVEMIVDQSPCPRKGGVKLSIELRISTNEDNGGIDQKLEFDFPLFGEDLHPNWGQYQAGVPPFRSRKMELYLPPQVVPHFLSFLWDQTTSFLKEVMYIKKTQEGLRQTYYFHTHLDLPEE